MTGNDTSTLLPGQSVSSDNGERHGCSHDGWAVRMRRRLREAGFVVTTDAPVGYGSAAEVIASEWATANAAFDRLMREH